MPVRARWRSGVVHLQFNKNIAAARGAWLVVYAGNSCDDMSGANILKPTARRNVKRLCVVLLWYFIMQNIVLINGKYFQRFHYMNAFYRWNGCEWDFISYRTHVLNVEPIVLNFKHCYSVTAYEWKGATTQKQISRFIREFCGLSYCKAYKKARNIMRKYNGDSLRLVQSNESNKFFVVVYGENTVLKDEYFYI